MSIYDSKAEENIGASNIPILSRNVFDDISVHSVSIHFIVHLSVNSGFSYFKGRHLYLDATSFIYDTFVVKNEIKNLMRKSVIASRSLNVDQKSLTVEKCELDGLRSALNCLNTTNNSCVVFTSSADLSWKIIDM